MSRFGGGVRVGHMLEKSYVFPNIYSVVSKRMAVGGRLPLTATRHSNRAEILLYIDLLQMYECFNSFAVRLDVAGRSGAERGLAGCVGPCKILFWARCNSNSRQQSVSVVGCRCFRWARMCFRWLASRVVEFAED